MHCFHADIQNARKDGLRIVGLLPQFNDFLFFSSARVAQATWSCANRAVRRAYVAAPVGATFPVVQGVSDSEFFSCGLVFDRFYSIGNQLGLVGVQVLSLRFREKEQEVNLTAQFQVQIQVPIARALAFVAGWIGNASFASVAGPFASGKRCGSAIKSA